MGGVAPLSARLEQPPLWKQRLQGFSHRLGKKVPNHQHVAGSSLVFIAVTNGPPHDSQGEGKARLPALLGGSGWVAFAELSLWVSATHAFLSSTTKDVVFLTACPHFVVTPRLALSC